MASGVSLQRMARRIERFQTLNSQIVFAVLNKHIQQNKEAQKSHQTIEVEHVHCFHPPVHKTLVRSSVSPSCSSSMGGLEGKESLDSSVYKELSFPSSGEYNEIKEGQVLDRALHQNELTSDRRVAEMF